MTPADLRIADPALAARLNRTARQLAESGATPSDVLDRYADQVPRELLIDLRGVAAAPDREAGYCVIQGLFHALLDVGPTPPGWDSPGTDTTALDIAIVLLACAMGSAFGWRNQQDGRLVHNIMPSRGFEDMQVGASSRTPLMWHTEDAFHPDRADLLVLACVRNPDRIGTRVAGVRRLGIDSTHLDALQRPVVEIRPDDSYPYRDGDATAADRGIATVWYDEDGPCLRYDPAYTRMLQADAEFAAAYDALGGALESYGGDVPLAPGDVCVVDNAVAVHGRVSFQPRFDGSDRWLKRIMVRTSRSRPETGGGYGQEIVEPRVRIEVPT